VNHAAGGEEKLMVERVEVIDSHFGGKSTAT
jgi:hypothetical protein